MANPTGKGGFQERPQDINREGLNAHSPNSWASTWQRITNMTREEAIKYVGARTKIGRLLKELPPNVPIKDGLAFISIIHYGRDPSPGMLSAIMDREEGKPGQSIALTNPDGNLKPPQVIEIIRTYKENDKPD